MSVMTDVKSLVLRILRAEESKQMSASATVPSGASLLKDCSKNSRRERKWHAQSSANNVEYLIRGWMERNQDGRKYLHHILHRHGKG